MRRTLGGDHLDRQLFVLTMYDIAYRFSLEVAQEPLHGRRKTEKDRRPLAHCPVLRMRIMNCKMQPNGGWDEEEVDIKCVILYLFLSASLMNNPAFLALFNCSDIESSHLVCAADLCSPSTPTFNPSTTAHSPSAFSQSPRSSSSPPPRRSPPLPPEASGTLVPQGSP